MTDHPTPVTPERLSQAFDSLGIIHRVTDHLPELLIPLDGMSIVTGFDSCMITADIISDQLRFRATWRGCPQIMMAAAVLGAVSQWNATRLSPRMDFTTTSDSYFTINLCRTQWIKMGLTDEQLAIICESTISAILEACEWLAQAFPHAVTWDKEQN